jgi:hypothetical protein
MASTKRITHGVLAGLLALGAGGPSILAAQESAALDRLDKVIQVYLLQDCGVGDSDPAASLKAVLELGQEAVPSLVRALREGPTVDERSRVERQAAEDFRGVWTYLDEGGLEELEEEDVREAALALEESAYTAMRVAGLVKSYRERALNALLQLDASALEGLEDALDDEDLRRWLVEGLERSRAEAGT